MYNKKDRFSDSEIIGPASDFVRKGMAEYLFNNSDRIQFLFQHPIPYNIINTDEFKHSEFGFLKSNFVRKRSGTSYGMKGDIIEFKIDKKMCDFFIKKGVALPFLKLKNCNCALENATFLKNGKVIVSECSHEGIIDINPEMKRDFEDEYIRLIKEDIQFASVKKSYFNLNPQQRKEWQQKGEILHYLKAYIDEDNQEYIRQSTPRYCSFEEFKEIVKTYLSENVYEYFNKFKRFGKINYFEIPDRFFAEKNYLDLIYDGKIK